MPNEEGNAVNDSAVQDTAATDSAPAETPSLEVVTEGPDLNPNDYQDVETDSAPEPATDKPEAEAEETPETDTPPEGDKPLAPKSENRFQKLANENRELREQLQQLNSREAQIAAEQELLSEIDPETGEYYRPADAERLARLQSLQQAQASAAQDRQQLEVQQHQATLNSEAEQVVQDFAIFNPESPEFNKEVAAEAAKLLETNLVYDDQGTFIGSRVSPYQLYKTVATAYQAAAVTAKIEGQKATEKMLSHADTPSSTKPSKSTTNDKDLSPGDYAKKHNLETVW